MDRTVNGKKKENPEFLESIINEWRTVFDSISDMVSVLDRDNRIIRVNRPFAQFVGAEIEDIIGRKCHEVLHGTDKPVSYCPIAESISDKRHIKREIYDPNLKKYFMISLSPILSNNGSIKGIVHVMRDITESKHAEEDVIVKNRAIESSLSAMGITDAEGKLMYVNESLLRMWGYKHRDEVLGRNLTEFWEGDRVYKTIENTLKKGGDIGEDRGKRKDGSVFDVQFSSTLIKDKDGQPQYFFASFIDITERKKGEDAVFNLAKGISSAIGDSFFVSLSESLAKLLEADYVYIAEILDENPCRAKTLALIADGQRIDNIEVDLAGTPCETVIGHRTCSYPSEVQKLFPDAVVMAKLGAEGYVGTSLIDDVGNHIGLMSVIFRRKIGNVKFVESTLQIFADRATAEILRKRSDDKLMIYHDALEYLIQERTRELEMANKELVKEIQDRVEAEEALRKSEERFRAAATSTLDLLWEGDVRDNSLNWYGDIDRFLGHEEGGFPRTISGHMEHIHPDDRDLFLEKVDTALKTGADFRANYRIKCLDGSYRYWDETGKAVEYDNGKPVRWVGSVTDITNRKEIENQIIKSEEQFKRISREFNALLDGIPDNIILLERELRILWANRAATKKAHSESEAMKGKYCYSLCFNISAPCENCPVEKSFVSGKEESARRIGPTGKVWDLRAFPIKDDNGNIERVIEVARDVSARVKLEQEAADIQAKLIHTNKMTSLGTLLSGVAHEINNPNSFIMTNADLFKDIWSDTYNLLKDHDGKMKDTYLGGIKFTELQRLAPELLNGIYEGSGRIKNIIENLRSFARSDSGDMDDKVNLNDAVKTATTILNAQIKKCTDNFHVLCEDSVPPVMGNSQQIEQVIINLILNALQALPDKSGSVRVSTRYDAESGLAIVKIEDTGTGIPQSIIDRITEPFFTTKMDSGGTGLGLSISYAIVRDHNGSLEFSSVCNEKTAAYIKLPACS
ncbi:MAG: PAS domain S-box protein [Nitrospiraceae bacterium]|nr:MAG: PAS domain S-box protein [Nitrospiraceae bacterium]